MQSLGLLNSSDEPTRDAPFVVAAPGSEFATLPYAFHVNDVVSFPFQGWNRAAYQEALRDEFDQLYDEGAGRGRMMVLSLHDRILVTGLPSRRGQ